MTRLACLLALLLAGCVTANDDDSAVDDVTPAEPGDTEVLGYLFLGAIDDIEEPSPAPPGISVQEVGTGLAADTDAEGLFRIFPAGEDSFELEASYDVESYLPTVVGVTWEQWDLDPFVELELEERSHNNYHYVFEYDQAYSLGHGTLLVGLGDPDGDEPLPVGTTVSINGDHGGSFALLDDGGSVATDTLPADADPELNFARVSPGVAQVTVTPPPGWTCVGPSQITIRADTLSVVNYSCR